MTRNLWATRWGPLADLQGDLSTLELALQLPLLLFGYLHKKAPAPPPHPHAPHPHPSCWTDELQPAAWGQGW